MTIRPRRSVLYMPGSNARALEKARTLAADTLILDLEDAVAPAAKETARRQVCDACRGGGYGPRELVVRVNGRGTPWFEDDLAAAAAAGPAAVLVPKVQSARDVAELVERWEALSVPDGIRLWAMLETPLAMLNAKEIAACGGRTSRARLDVLVMGTNDLAKETRAELRPGRAVFMPWLMTGIAAARAFDLAILDGAFNDFRDGEGFARECLEAKAMGFDGKTLIHPDQIAAANATFAPTGEEVASARRIIEAFDSPQNAGKGVINLDGRMVELLHAESARRTIAVADAIAARG